MNDELNTIKKKNPLNVITNLHSSNQPGIHWNCFYINGEKKNISLIVMDYPQQKKLKIFWEKEQHIQHLKFRKITHHTVDNYHYIFYIY